ncbi:MAG: hypothetical protein M1812_001247 [Candelaria pacifica]|nr:MAG: hypothetical protein M1812_001247 [Candelaria pacifica]
MGTVILSLGVFFLNLAFLVGSSISAVDGKRHADRCGYPHRSCPEGYECVEAPYASTCRKVNFSSTSSSLRISTDGPPKSTPTPFCSTCSGGTSLPSLTSECGTCTDILTVAPTATPSNSQNTSIIVSHGTGVVSEPTSRPSATSTGNYTAIVGASRSDPVKVVERLPIDVLQRDHVDEFNLYILALESLQSRAENDDLSWYQLGGIHGYPHIPWQYPSSLADDTNYGYCTHTSLIFLPWHRPYVLAFEQILSEEAVSIAKRFTGSSATKYQTAAENLRAPYWDWASNDTRSRIPDVVSIPTINVVRPGSNGIESNSSIPNPLYSYKFAAVHTDGGLGATTVRSSSADDILTRSFSSRQHGVLELFSLSDFNSFSTKAEGIHGDIHTGVGGNMAIVDRAGFDPIFWLHHCQVDRIYSLYQATHPGGVLTADGTSTITFALHGDAEDDLFTPLYPFRHPSGKEFNSDDIKTAQSTFTYGYTYPEVPVGLSEQDLQAYAAKMINKLYGPSLDDGSFAGNTSGAQIPTARLEWSANVLLDSDDVNGTHRILFYIGNSNNSNSSLSDNFRSNDTLVGVAGIFTGTTPMVLGNTMLNLTVPLTNDLVKNNIALRANDTVPELASRLYWVVEKVQDMVNEIPPTDIKSLKIAVSSTVTQYFPNTAMLPVKSNPLTYYAPTAGKDGGLQPGEAPPVGAVAPPVLDSLTGTNTTAARFRRHRKSTVLHK